MKIMNTDLHDGTPLTDENIKKWTFEIWSYLDVERMWEAGDRPVLDLPSFDLLFMTPLDSYCRARQTEHDGNSAFEHLTEALSMKQIVPVVMHNGSVSRWFANPADVRKRAAETFYQDLGNQS